jgi:hypothetical protein
MLWLTGVLGLLAVGSVAMVDFSAPEDDAQQKTASPEGETPFLLSQDLLNKPSEDAGSADKEISEDPADFFTSASHVEMDPEYLEDTDFEDALTTSPATLEANTSLPDMISLDADTEELLVVWDDVTIEPPEITCFEHPDDPSVTEICAGDVPLAHVRSDHVVSADSVSLVPLSTAKALGWVDA